MVEKRGRGRECDEVEVGGGSRGLEREAREEPSQ